MAYAEKYSRLSRKGREANDIPEKRTKVQAVAFPAWQSAASPTANAGQLPAKLHNWVVRA
jgi:hypothetical protein